MSLRETSAWITFGSVLLVFGAYFGGILLGLFDARGVGAAIALAVAVIALVVLQGGLHAAAAFNAPADARAPRDEREALIQARSHTVGYYVLTAMVLALAAPAHFGHPVPDILNFALLGVVVSTLSVSLAQIIMFRRGL